MKISIAFCVILMKLFYIFSVEVSSKEICKFNSFYESKITCFIIQGIEVDLKEYKPPPFKKIVTVDINNLKMDQIPAGLFKVFPDVESAFIKANILFLKTEDFDGAVNVKILHILQSKFKVLGNNSFKYCTSLKSLEICHSQIEEIEVDAFAGLKLLEVLKIFDSKLKSLKPGTLNFLVSLEHLNVSNGNVSVISVSLFKNLQKLESLVLDHLNLNEISENAFESKIYKFVSVSSNNLLSAINSKTENCDISSNQLTNITLRPENLVFQANRNYIKEIFCQPNLNITFLELEMNLLENLQCILQLVKLNYLNLSHNKLEAIPKNSFENLTRLETILLDGNNLLNFEIIHFRNSIRKLIENRRKRKNNTEIDHS